MLVHLNGQLVEHDQARVSVFDRGFVFGDAIYEGLRALPDPRTGQIRVVGLARHIRRLQAGLNDAGIPWDAAQIGPLTQELLGAARVRDAFVYWQISRGTPDLSRGPARSRVPAGESRPTVFGYASPLPALDLVSPSPAVKRARVVEDLRWLRGRLKCTSLLGNVLAALDAAHHGDDEAIFVRETASGRVVTEGTYTNVAIARPDGSVITPSLGSAPLLAGVTRQILLDHEPSFREGRVTEADLRAASEVLLIGTTTMVTSVTHLDGRQVGTGAPGPAAGALLSRLCRLIRENAEDAHSPG